METAKSSQDLLNVAEALSIASQGSVKFMSPEHAKAVWLEYLRVSNYDVPKKVVTKSVVVSSGTTDIPLIVESK